MSERERVTVQLQVGHESVLLQPPINRPDIGPVAHTHRWTVFVRGQRGQPLDSALISQVAFQLHTDYPKAKRVIKCPPFEVTETGYAGFTLPLFVTFNGCSKEFAISYDLNLANERKSQFVKLHSFEFKDPKPLLRERLIKVGASVVVKAAVHAPTPAAVSKPQKTQFESLFGPTLTVIKKPVPVASKPLSGAWCERRSSQSPAASPASVHSHKSNGRSPAATHASSPNPHKHSHSLNHSSASPRHEKPVVVKKKKRKRDKELEPKRAKTIDEQALPPPADWECAPVLDAMSVAGIHLAKPDTQLDKALVAQLLSSLDADPGDADELVRQHNAAQSMNDLFSTGDSSPEPAADRETSHSPVPATTSDCAGNHTSSKQVPAQTSVKLEPAHASSKPASAQTSLKPEPAPAGVKSHEPVQTSSKYAHSKTGCEPAPAETSRKRAVEQDTDRGDMSSRLSRVQQGLESRGDNGTVANGVAQVVLQHSLAFSLDQSNQYIEFELRAQDTAAVTAIESVLTPSASGS